MSTRNSAAKQLAIVTGVALLGLGGGFVLESGVLLQPVYAQHDDSGGGHESGGGKGGSGGHESGGGKGKGGSGGHESGGGCGGGGGSCGGGGHEEPLHGTRGGHEGHASGTHGSGSEGGRGSSQGRRFGGGSGIGTLEAVPEGPGQHGHSYGAGPQNRFRYWGGWSVPVDGTDGTVTAGDSTTVYSSGTTILEGTPLSSGGGAGTRFGAELSGADRCEGVGGQMSAAARISGRNLSRINAAHEQLVEPGVKPDKVAPFLLANFQEEMEKPKPDLQLAGIYLGTIAGRPVTAGAVNTIGRALCLSVGAGQAEPVAVAAEDQRKNKSTLRVARQAGAAK
jgi:hypothetical protein